MIMRDQIVWLDMPVLQMDRAIKFYSAILAGDVELQSFEQFNFAVLPHADTNVSGCLVPGSSDDIIKQGPLIYFNVDGRMDQALALVTSHGGDIIETKHAIGPHGFRAIVHDSEGNRIALHSHQA
jgi:uncharacterized protein